MKFLRLCLVLFLLGCSEARPPETVEICELTGSPYQRGFQHGKRFSHKIQSIYTTLLENSLLPFLNREQKDIASFLSEYQKPLYDDGRFSYEMLLQSGRHLEEQLEQEYPEYVEEMRGIADGSGVDYDKILILNTFVDTMLAFRSITFFIRQIQAPFIVSVEILADGMESDGEDNNGDGVTDDDKDMEVRNFRHGKWLNGYGPSPHAAMVEVPSDAAFRFILDDPPALSSFGKREQDLKEGERQGVDPDSIRIQLDDKLYEASHPSISTEVLEDETSVEVIFTPPDGLPEASVVALVIQAGNISTITDPPPVHARNMRDERIVFTTTGTGKEAYEIPNRGLPDGRTQPPSLAFGVRGPATDNDQLMLGHHFALLDANVSHKHTVLFIHRPKTGKAHAVLGWTGLIWGFSGMNEDGLAVMTTMSDTLNNPLTSSVRQDITEALLLSSGTPVGMAMRHMLSTTESLEEATDYLKWIESTFGWNLLIGDQSGEMAVVELDSDILDDEDQGYHVYMPDSEEPQNTDEHGQLFASVGPDDIRIASHFQKKVEDIDTFILFFDVRPQRYWSSFYFRSLRTYHSLGEEIADRYGSITLDGMFEILRNPLLVDQRDSMNAVVFEPSKLVLHYAMGQVPATDGSFIRFDLGSYLAGEDQR
jgi:hypothetical protein